MKGLLLSLVLLILLSWRRQNLTSATHLLPPIEKHKSHHHSWWLQEHKRQENELRAEYAKLSTLLLSQTGGPHLNKQSGGLRHWNRYLDKYIQNIEGDNNNVTTIAQLIHNLRDLRARARRSNNGSFQGLVITENNNMNNTNKTKRNKNVSNATSGASNNITWPLKKAAEIEGDIYLGGLMMVHEREDTIICGPVMPQVGLVNS